MSGKYSNVSQAVIDLDAFQLHGLHPHHCPLDEMVDLALEAFMQTQIEVSPPVSKQTFDRCRAAMAATKLRAGWLPSKAP